MSRVDFHFDYFRKNESNLYPVNFYAVGHEWNAILRPNIFEEKAIISTNLFALNFFCDHYIPRFAKSSIGSKWLSEVRVTQTGFIARIKYTKIPFSKFSRICDGLYSIIHHKFVGFVC